MEENEAVISVIIPCHNHGHYLKFALDSVVTQTFSQWEAIVVDDGSTDLTAKVVQAYPNPRICYFYQENQGLSTARNKGIRAAKGRFLAFLDADDEWDPEFLSTCYHRLESESGIAGVFTQCRYIDPDGTILPTIGGQEVEPSDFRSRLLEGGFFPPNAILIRASILERSGLFDTDLTSAEDWDLWLRISQWQGMRGLPLPLARYRVYSGSMSTNTERMHENRLAVLTKHFGSTDNNVAKWPVQKRMSYGFAFRTTAVSFLGQGNDDLAWHWMERAFNMWPPLLERLDTFYELACKDQPRGYRGKASMMDIGVNASDMLTRLDTIWANATEEIVSHRNVALGNANLAIGMLFDQAGNWPQARGFLVKAIQANRDLATDSGVLRRLVKVSILTPGLVAAIPRLTGSRSNAGL